MNVLRRLPTRPLRRSSPVAAIGIFDGVHRGHQAILKKAARRASFLKGTPAAITFFPHPLTVLAPALVPSLLLSLEQRLKAFQRCGIRVALVIPFTKAFSRLSPQDFVEQILVERLKVREVVVGHDFGFGKGRLGTVDTLRALGGQFGFKVHVVAPIRVGGERISSRRIRDLIREGKLSKASQLLGRPVTAVGRVVRGTRRGKNLGFPTANLKVEAGVLPSVGVYAVRGQVNGRRYTGMANVGFRPTFEGPSSHASPLLEVHLFGVTRSLYGQHLEVAFLKRLRSERRFPSAWALTRQLILDARRAREFSLYLGRTGVV